MSTAESALAWLRQQPVRFLFWDTAEHAEAYLQQSRLTARYRTVPVPTDWLVKDGSAASEAAYFDDPWAGLPIDRDDDQPY